jgi:redox-sensitive bicupin YhaK (pirin superfamily)
MHGLQLWVALPEAARHGEPRFDSHGDLPVVRADDASVTVVVGAYAGAASPALVHTPLLGLEARLPAAGAWLLERRPAYEHAVLVLTGSVRVDGRDLERGSLLYLPPGGTSSLVEALEDAVVFVLGGEPFDEPLVMWWNFVARSHEEVVAARDDWAAGRRFGRVEGCERDALPAPAMPGVRLKARDRHGRSVG